MNNGFFYKIEKKYALFSLLLLLTSCFLWKEEDLSNIQVIDKGTKPLWMKDNKCNKDVLCSIGMSIKNDSSFGLRVKEAELIGRQSIITKIKAAILNAIKGESLIFEKNKSIDFEKIVEKSLSGFDLLLIKRNDIFVDEKGTIFINMRISENLFNNELNKFKVRFEKNLKNSEILYDEIEEILIAIDKLKEELCKK